MRLDVLLTADEATRFDFTGYLAAVIDVLRATTTIVAALEAGFGRIIPVSTIEEANRLRSRHPGTLLAGERDGFRPEGFDFGNSPLELEAAGASRDARGKSVVLTTTNGTRATVAARAAERLYSASLTNITAAADRIAADLVAGVAAAGVVIVCSGTDGRFSIEDVYAAGRIVTRLCSRVKELELSDSAAAARMIAAAPLDEAVTLETCRHLGALVGKGFSADVEYAFRVDRSAVVPVFRDGAFFRE